MTKKNCHQSPERVHAFAPPLPAGKSGYDWVVAPHYEFMLGEEGFALYQAEIDAGRPLVVCFKYWNPIDLDIAVYAPGSEEIVVHVFA